MTDIKSCLTHKNIFFFGLILMAVGMPLSRFLVSISHIILAVNWLIERNFISKWQTLKLSKHFWTFTGIYFLLLLGVFWSGDVAYTFKDLKVKLPMLWLPLLFFTTELLSKKQYHIILHFFVASTIIASFCSMIALLGFTHKKINNIRDISLFESHIRFSLMLVFSVCYLLFYTINIASSKQRILYIILSVWIIVFLFILQSFTGLFILTVLSFVTVARFLFLKQPKGLKLGIILSFTFLLLYISYLTFKEWKKITYIKPVNYSEMPAKTKRGCYYWKDLNSTMTENGNLVYSQICEDELKPLWNKNSAINYDSLDAKNNKLKSTLFRYMASKGLNKDAEGFLSLNKQDIKNIENGKANYLYTNPYNIKTRLHELIWEVAEASKNENPEGHSLTMRFEFWKTAWHIIRQRPLIGVGTGDVDKVFDIQYSVDKCKLSKRWRLRAHNQFISITVALGFIGLIFFLIHLATPFLFKNKPSFLFVLFLLIQWLSFINEDTLETQAGVTFCIFFTQFFFKHDQYNKN